MPYSQAADEIKQADEIMPYDYESHELNPRTTSVDNIHGQSNPPTQPNNILSEGILRGDLLLSARFKNLLSDFTVVLGNVLV